MSTFVPPGPIPSVTITRCLFPTGLDDKRNSDLSRAFARDDFLEANSRPTGKPLGSRGTGGPVLNGLDPFTGLQHRNLIFWTRRFQELSGNLLYYSNHFCRIKFSARIQHENHIRRYPVKAGHALKNSILSYHKVRKLNRRIKVAKL